MSPTGEEFEQQASVDSLICQAGLWRNHYFGWTLAESLYFLISYLGQVDVCVSCPSRKKHTSKPTLYLLYSLYSIYHI